MDKQTKFKLELDKAFQNEKPYKNLVQSASKDYNIPLGIVDSIYNKDQKNFYDNLEYYIKPRAKK